MSIINLTVSVFTYNYNTIIYTKYNKTFVEVVVAIELDFFRKEILKQKMSSNFNQ